MYDFFADSSAIGEKEIIIRGSDLNHMKNVLRLQIGEQICIHEESTGKEYRCEIAGYEKVVAHLHIMWVEEANRELPSKIYLFQGLPKGDKMEMCIRDSAMVFQTEKALEEVGDKVDANDKTAVEADLNELKDLIAKSNPEEMTESQVAEIKAAKEKLMESAQKVFAKMYEQQAQANGAAQAGPDMNAGADNSSYQSDDVVDGDYKEV